MTRAAYVVFDGGAAGIAPALGTTPAWGAAMEGPDGCQHAQNVGREGNDLRPFIYARDTK